MHEQVVVTGAQHVQCDVRRGRLATQARDTGGRGVQAGQQLGEVEIRRAEDDELTVEHELRAGDGAQRVDDLREVPRERPLVAAAQVDVVTVAERETAEAVPLRLEEPVVALGQRATQHREHRRDRRCDGQGHGGSIPTSVATFAAMTTPIEIVREFCAAWTDLDVDRICSYFTDDATYHNIPIAPVTGRDAIRATIEGFTKDAERVEFRVGAIAADGDVVMTERVDVFFLPGVTVELPVMGTFELRGGKIAAWRDYFDLAQFTSQLPSASA